MNFFQDRTRDQNEMPEERELKAVLVALDTGEESAQDISASLDELASLLETAGGTECGRIIQNRPTPDVKTYIGSGKVSELSDFCKANEIELVIFDNDLSPSQIRNIEDAVETEVRVLDRSMLILDIFALHAVTGEGKIQVELAQLKYTVPRLIGKGHQLSRLGGGIGTRGPGESKLESDRRHIQRRIHALEEQIEELAKNRQTMRASRDRSGIPRIAIVGYTSAGKSTLLNRLTDAGVLCEDKLFSTLDPTTRKYALPNGEPVLLTDTVGFIRKLPHQLISAFHSTLDEAVYADMILIVIDISDEHFPEKIRVTEDLLNELGCKGKPTLYVFNKCDVGPVNPETNPTPPSRDSVYISAKTGEGIPELVASLERLVQSGKKEKTYWIPNDRQKLVNRLHQYSQVLSVEYGEQGVKVVAVVDEREQGYMKEYEV